MSWEGCEIRELSGRGREFTLADPDLTWIAVNYQARLLFCRSECMIGGPFTLQMADALHDLDPNERAALGPLLALYPDTLTRLEMSPDGTLRGTSASGTLLTVPPDPQYADWNICGLWCPPCDFTH